MEATLTQLTTQVEEAGPATDRREPPRPLRPAIWIALPLATGITLSGSIPAWLGGYAAAAAILAAMVIVFASVRGACLPLAAAALLLAGIAWAQIDRYFVPANSVANWSDAEPMLIRARIKLTEPPILRNTSVAGAKATACRAEVLAIDDSGTWREASGSVLLRISGSRDDLRADQQLQVIGDLSRITPPANPGEYDWSSHFARERIFARLSVQRPEVVTVLAGSSESMLSRARRAVRDALKVGLSGDENSALLQTLLLGDSDDRLESVWADFRASGTAHHLSISGMHIVAVAGAVLLLGRALMAHPRTLVIVAMATAIAYAAMVRSSPPVTRSVLLCLAMGLAVLFKRNTDPVQCLFAAVVVMLIWNPLDLMNPGFQLSCGTVAGLMLLTGKVTRRLMSFEHEHDRMARIIQPPHGVAALMHRWRHKLTIIIASGMVAYAITLPLVLIHFGQVNPWAVPGSVLLAPLVTLTLLTGLAKMLVCLIVPSAASILAWPAEASAALMRWCVGWLASLPGAQLTASPLPIWVVGVYCLLLALPLLPQVRTRRAIWIAPAAAVLLLMAWPLTAKLPTSRHDLTVTFLSVGNASCTIAQLPGGENIFIDCGGARQRDLFASTIEPFLRNDGISAIQHVLITHEDSDHRLALPDIQQRFAPQVWQHLRGHQTLAVPGSTTWEILGPHAQTPLRGNNASTVVRITFAGRSILFTGDIQQEGIEELLRSGRSLAADILVAPHHGSSVDATADLIRAVHPSLLLCSSSSRLSRLQQNFDRLSAGSPLLRTGASGAIRITVSPDGNLKVTTYRNGSWT